MIRFWIKRNFEEWGEAAEVRESGRPGPLGSGPSLWAQGLGSHWSREKILGSDWLIRARAGVWPCQPGLGSDHLPEPRPLWLVTRPTLRNGARDVSIRPRLFMCRSLSQNFCKLMLHTIRWWGSILFIFMNQAWTEARDGPCLVTQATMHTEQKRTPTSRLVWVRVTESGAEHIFPKCSHHTLNLWARCGAWCGRGGEWMEKIGSMDHQSGFSNVGSKCHLRNLIFTSYPFEFSRGRYIF